MSILRLSGLLLAILGLVSGAALLVAPFGVLAVPEPLGLWLLFAGCLVGGFLLAALGSTGAGVAGLRTLFGVVLFALAVLAAGALVADKIGLLHASGTGSLWGLFATGTLLGAAALLAGPMPGESAPRSGASLSGALGSHRG